MILEEISEEHFKKMATVSFNDWRNTLNPYENSILKFSALFSTEA
jgi:hypothetical protein